MRSKRLLSFILAGFFLTCGYTAFADLTLPASLKTIGESSFEGDTAVSSIAIPDGTETLSSRALAGTALYEITIPESVTAISTTAFDEINTPLLIKTDPGSFAVRYALQYNRDFRAGTVCRALLIGQSAYPEEHALAGPAVDMTTMSSLLGNDYAVTVAENLSRDEIFNTITEAFGSATDEDISLFYYSGHGLQSSDPDLNGALVGIDGMSFVTATELRNALDAVPGRKIVLIDACYSGGLLEEAVEAAGSKGDGTVEESTPDGDIEDPVSAFITAFSKPRRYYLRSSLAAQQYFVLASSKSTEKSWEEEGGVFTNCFAASKNSADTNLDGVITFLEAYEYTAQNVNAIVSEEGLSQSVQAYPENCYWFGLFR